MKKLIQKIVVSILSLIVFVTTSGFYTFQHRCIHDSDVQNSIFLELNCCHQYSLGHIFSTHVSVLTIDQANCCKTESNYYKLNSPFEENVSKKIQHSFERNPVIKDIRENTHNIALHSTKHPAYAINGPPLIGKQFLFFVHQLKLSPPVC